jgi:Flp pilus assembly protein TadD
VFPKDFALLAPPQKSTYNSSQMTSQSRRLVLLIAILTLASTALFADVSSEVKGQLKYGVRAAREAHWDEAIYRWRRVLQLDPKNLMAHNNLAVAYEQTGDYQLALEEYENAYRLDSGNQYVKNNLDRFKDFYKKYRRYNNQ